MLREMSTRYGRSPGGYVWAVVEPLGMILVLSIGFSLLLRTPPLGSSFLLFYATGYLPFQMYLKTSQYVASSLRYSRALLTYPVVGWFEAILARIVTNAITLCIVSAVLLLGIMGTLPGSTTVEPGPVFMGFLIAFFLGCGVGLVNCVAAGFFPVWGTLWSIATAPIFLMSGILWIYEDLPHVAQDILIWNPLVHVTGYTRSGFFTTYDPQHIDLAYVWAIALVLIALGLLLVRRFHRDILQN